MGFAFPKMRKRILQHKSIINNFTIWMFYVNFPIYLHVMGKLYFMVKIITWHTLKANKFKIRSLILPVEKKGRHLSQFFLRAFILENW